MRIVGPLFCLLITLLLAGCSAPRLLDGRPEGSLVYAYLDLTEAESKLDWATLKQILPKTDRPYYYMGYTRDKENKYAATVWFAGLSSGTYQLSEFGGSRYSFWRMGTVLSEFKFADTGENDTAVSISDPGFYFMGAYKYRNANSRWARLVSMGRFDLEPLASPTRAEVLEGLLPVAKGTNWEGRIKNELASKQP